MRRDDGGLLVALVGLFALVVGLTDVVNRYLRPTMSPWLALSGLVLLALGLATLVTGWWSRRRAPEPADHGSRDQDRHGDGHRHGFSRVGWLLAVPVACAIVVNPGALGSYAVGRQTDARNLASLDFDLEEHLRTHTYAGQAADLNLAQLQIAADDPAQAELLAETPLRVEGFVVNRDGRPLVLARILVGCCAGDGLPLTVDLRGYDGPALADDQWVRVEGTLDAESTDAARADDERAAPVLAVERIEEIDEPSEPYLYPF